MSHGECDRAEQTAGVVVVSSGGAFLIGNAVIRSLNEKLRRSYDPYYRKDTKGHVYSRTVIGCAKLAVKEAVDHVGKLVTLASASASAHAFLDLSTENDGLNSLYNRGRIVVANGIASAGSAIVVIGA